MFVCLSVCMPLCLYACISVCISVYQICGQWIVKIQFRRKPTLLPLTLFIPSVILITYLLALLFSSIRYLRNSLWRILRSAHLTHYPVSTDLIYCLFFSILSVHVNLDLSPGSVFYYENMEGGHGGAADNKQQAFMNTLYLDFLWKTIGKK